MKLDQSHLSGSNVVMIGSDDGLGELNERHLREINGFIALGSHHEAEENFQPTEGSHKRTHHTQRSISS